MNKIPTILMTSPKAGFGRKIQWTLLKRYNCSLGNNLSASKCDPSLVNEFPDAKHIIPIFGYKESWDRMFITYDEWQEERIFRPNGTNSGKVYYYNCGTGDWPGLDEPGSRGKFGLRLFNYGRAFQENEMIHKFMPNLNTVVTHPFPLPIGAPIDSSPRYKNVDSDVWAWQFNYIMSAGLNWREKFDVPQDKEVWGYWIDNELSTRNLADTGEICRKYGISACLIYKAEHPALYNVDEPDIRKRMTPKALALLEGM